MGGHDSPTHYNIWRCDINDWTSFLYGPSLNGASIRFSFQSIHDSVKLCFNDVNSTTFVWYKNTKNNIVNSSEWIYFNIGLSEPNHTICSSWMWPSDVLQQHQPFVMDAPGRPEYLPCDDLNTTDPVRGRPGVWGANFITLVRPNDCNQNRIVLFAESVHITSDPGLYIKCVRSSQIINTSDKYLKINHCHIVGQTTNRMNSRAEYLKVL